MESLVLAYQNNIFISLSIKFNYKDMFKYSVNTMFLIQAEIKYSIILWEVGSSWSWSYGSWIFNYLCK